MFPGSSHLLSATDLIAAIHISSVWQSINLNAYPLLLTAIKQNSSVNEAIYSNSNLLIAKSYL